MEINTEEKMPMNLIKDKKYLLIILVILVTSVILSDRLIEESYLRGKSDAQTELINGIIKSKACQIDFSNGTTTKWLEDENCTVPEGMIVYTEEFGILTNKQINEKDFQDEFEKKEISFGRNPQYCVCSSEGLLELCSDDRTKIENDSLVRNGLMKENYCGGSSE